MNRVKKGKILIVDDSSSERDLFSKMLSDEYGIIEAENGEEAINILNDRSNELAIVLLDLDMPIMNGFAVLAYMNKMHWIGEIPVIITTPDVEAEDIARTYELGVADYITPPFNPQIVKRRVFNTILTYARQRSLANIVADRVYENEKNKNLMVAILSHIVEFRNGESAMHVINITLLAKLFAEKLAEKTDKYAITHDQVNLISNAAALHDIGKISVPYQILNKPGPLTDTEFDIVKTHSRIGADMLKTLPVKNHEEPLLKTAYEVCRWHHERYDGRGYPDGLVGDDIPISAQIVALADVYDALTHERCYKAAYTHDEAIKMILNGECGSFNPLLMEVLSEIAASLPERMEINSIEEKSINETVYHELLRYDKLFTSMQKMQNVQTEHLKYQFLLDETPEPVISFNYDLSLVILSKNATKKLRLPEVFANPERNEKFIKVFGDGFMDKLSRALQNVTPDEPKFSYGIECNVGGTKILYEMRAFAIFKVKRKISSLLVKLVEKKKPRLPSFGKKI